MNPLLQVSQLQVSFRTDHGIVTPIRNVTFHVDRCAIVGIIGESGSGKTVTAHAIPQLLARDADIKGSILFDGEELLTKGQREIEGLRGKRIAVIFQDPMTSLNPTMRIGKQIAESVRKHRQLSQEAASKEALELLHLVKMPQAEAIMSAFPYQLSGGMLQRVVIAIALAGNPSLLIADEPTTALDSVTQGQILSLLKEIQKAREMSILFISHDLGVVSEICDKVVVMYGGTVVEEAEVKRILQHPEHPYTEALLKAVPRTDGNRKLSLIPIEGQPPHPMELGARCPFVSRCPHAMRICELHQPPSYVLEMEHRAACWRHHPIGDKL
jgi:oligopeptide transport system ATP-binding protein